MITVDETSNEAGELFAEGSMIVAKDAVKLWWPNGYGRQTLYNLYVKWEDDLINSIQLRDRDTMISEKIVRVGFRSVQLRQEKANDRGLMFYFLVNEIPIFMKGSNWIPSSVLPESSYDENYGKLY